jgi:hypothetical protein
MQNNDSVVTEDSRDVGREGILAFRSKSGSIHKVDGAFGGVVYFKEWTSEERDNFEASLIVGRGKSQRVTTANIRAKMFVRSVCDKDGKLIFSDEDAKEVGKLPAPEVEKVYAEIQKVNSVSDEDVEELAGNSNSDR